MTLEPLDVRDSRTFFAGVLLGALAVAVFAGGVGGLWGFAFTLVALVYAAWALPRLFSRRVRLRIDDDGIVDRSFWFSPGRIRWDEITQVRPTRWGLIRIDLVDERAVLRRQPALARVMLTKLRLLGGGPAPLVANVLAVEKDDLVERIEAGMDRWALEVMRGEGVGEEE